MLSERREKGTEWVCVGYVKGRERGTECMCVGYVKEEGEGQLVGV